MKLLFEKIGNGRYLQNSDIRFCFLPQAERNLAYATQLSVVRNVKLAPISLVESR